jgi:chromosome segregation ATPase
MNSVVEYRSREAAIYPYIDCAYCGGCVDEIPKRLSHVEGDVSALKVQVGAISAVLPTLATKIDLRSEISDVKIAIADLRAELRTELKTEISGVRIEIGEVRTEIAEVRADLKTSIGEVRTEIAEVRADLKTSIGEVRTEIAEVRTEIAEVRTEIAEVRADLKGSIGEVRTKVAEVKTEVASQETRIVKWMIATVLTAAGVAFSLARFVH